jgi:hypothetical protein
MKKQKLSKSILGIIGASALFKLIKAASKAGPIFSTKKINQSIDRLETSLNNGKKPEDQIKLQRIKLIDFFRK